MTKAQAEAQKRYDAKSTRYFGLKLCRATDGDLIDKLESVPSIQGYLKELIKKDIGKAGR